MQFEIINKGQACTYTQNVIYLYEDNWNDWFRYVTMFHLVYVDGNAEKHELGSAKFGQFGMSDDQSTPNLPNVFETIGEQFFSLGQSEDYYENIKALEEGELREEILTALNDLAFNLQLFELASSEQVTQQSLLRDIMSNTVTEQFHRIAKGGAKLTPFDIVYTLPNPASEGLKIEFHVVPNSCPPTNVHVIIGRNGVGKTHLFRSMINCLMHENADKHFGTFCLENESRLTAFPYQHIYKVPKEWLLEFLTSEDYNSITRKSKEHYAMIAAVAPKPRKPRKKL